MMNLNKLPSSSVAEICLYIHVGIFPVTKTHKSKTNGFDEMNGLPCPNVAGLVCVICVSVSLIIKHYRI